MTPTSFTAPASRDTTVHIVSDPHYRLLAANSAERKAMFEDDVASLRVTPAKRIVPGDVGNEDGSNVNQPADAAAAAAWLDALAPVVPWHAILGNHDNYLNNLGGGAAAIGQLGIPALRYSVDIGPARFLMVSPAVQVDNTQMQYEAAALTWLTAQLAAADRDCVIVLHAPLYSTVLDVDGGANISDGGPWDSETGECWAVGPNGTDDSQIRAAIDHPRARLYISGHIHSNPYTANIVGQISTGTHSITFLSMPGVAFTSPADRQRGADPLWTAFLTFTRAGLWQLRLREHLVRTWDTFGTQGRVVTVP